MSETQPAIAEKNRIFKITLVISAFLSMIFLDQTGVSVTLTSIQNELALSSATLSWMMNAYFLSLSACLLLFARLSDTLGIKNIFYTGIVVFMLASVGCATATSGPWIIATRALQGIGASMGYATYLLIFNYQVAKKYRGRVLGTAAAFGAIFLALGPLIGGFFSSVMSWRFLFWLNVPICAVCLFFTATAFRQDEHQHGPLLTDKLGLLFYLLAIVGLVCFLMEGSRLGWLNPYIVSAFAGSLAVFILFIYHEKKQHDPLVDLALFKNKVFTASIIILFGNYACVTSIVFWALWLQRVLGYSPLLAGIALLPAGVPYIFSSRIGGILYDRHGARTPLLIGSLFFLAGFIEMTVVAPMQQYSWFMLGMLSMGIGWGFVRPCAILSGLNSVPIAHKSMATGMISTMRQLGAAVGFALMYAVISTYENVSLTHIIQKNKLTVTTSDLNHLITQASANDSLSYLIPVIKTAHTHALSWGMGVISLLALLNLVLVIQYLHNDPEQADIS